jgi:hypothetical protein
MQVYMPQYEQSALVTWLEGVREQHRQSMNDPAFVDAIVSADGAQRQAEFDHLRKLSAEADARLPDPVEVERQQEEARAMRQAKPLMAALEEEYNERRKQTDRMVRDMKAYNARQQDQYRQVAARMAYMDE